MKLAHSGARGVFWRANARGTQEIRTAIGRQRGDWWIRWACPHVHLHREQIGPKSLAREESERHRIERPCPTRKPKPTSYLLADVIDDYLKGSKSRKRSWKDDERHGKRWKDRFPGRTLEEITTAELERIRTERLEKIKPATVNREFALLRARSTWRFGTARPSEIPSRGLGCSESRAGECGISPTRKRHG